MVTSVVIDQYTLLLEASWDQERGEAVEPVRAIAKNMATTRTAEARISFDQSRRLLAATYEPSVAEDIFENHIAVGHLYELVANGQGDPLVFDFPFLLHHGFDPSDLEATQSTDNEDSKA